MNSAQAILEIDFNDSSPREEVQISEKLIKEYQDLNEKLEKAIMKIKQKKRANKL